MKKSLSYLFVGATLLSLTAGATEVSAAPHDSLQTDATVEFTANTDAEIILPGTESQFIKPKGGKSSTKSGLRIEYVPDINFGSVKAEFGAKQYPAKVLEYEKLDDDKNVTGGKLYMPPFAQVTDADGEDSDWNLTAEATKFTSGTLTLANTSINIKKYKLTNTRADSLEGVSISDQLVGMTLPAGGQKITNVATQLMTTKSKTHSNSEGSKSSIVLGDDSYTPTKVYKVDDTITDLVLDKPTGDSPAAKTYKATVTWTLNNGL